MKMLKDFSEKLNLNGFLENLDPNQKRWAAILGSLGGFALLVSVFTGSESSSSTSGRKATIENILTDTDTRSVGMDGMAAQLKAMKREQENLKKELARTKATLAEEKKKRGNDPSVMREIGVLQSKLNNLENAAKEIGWQVEGIEAGQNSTVVGSQRTTIPSAMPRIAQKRQQIAEQPAPDLIQGVDSDPASYFQPAPVPVRPAIAQPPATVGPTRKKKEMTIKTVVSTKSVEEPEIETTNFYIPSGSILTGTLVTGLDAPTGQAARKEPFPVLIRVQKEAILPNRYTADVKECFLTAAGYGDLSSERAYLRGEKISCVTDDGGMIEQNLNAYLAGEDGKAGIRGRLVDKQGQIIAKSLLAGFAAGVAEAFGSTPVPTIQTNGSSEKIFQENYSRESLEYGAAQGASEALSKVADFYLDLAEQMFPVIEIDAGRPVDVVVTNGTELKVKS